MPSYQGIAEAADAARLHLLANPDGLPSHILDKLLPDTGTGSSPVDLVVHFAEAIYANHEEAGVGDTARGIAGGCAVLSEAFGFHGLNIDSRGSKMSQVMSGEEVESPPEPKAEYLPPAEVEG